MTGSKEFGEFDSAILADRLGFMAIALFAIYIITLLAGILPIRPLETAWQLQFISAALDSAPIPLVGLGLLHLSAYLDPGNPFLQRRRDAAARLAIPVVIGFLLIVPLQSYAAWRNVVLARADVARQLSAATSTFDLLQAAITSASSLDNLQARLLAIQAPSLGVPLEDPGLSLPEAKQQLLVRLKEVRRQVEARIQASTPRALGSLVRDSLRVMLSSLALAIAFAMGAQRKGSEVPLLVEWHTMLTVRSPRERNPDRGILKGLPIPGASTADSEADQLTLLGHETDSASATEEPPRV
jgi:hypothetical protein